MPASVRYPSGVTQDQIWQPLGHAGFPDPFFYNVFYQDFNARNPAASIVQTVTGTSTSALIAGDGGILQFSTSAGATDYVSIQNAVSTFQLIPATPTVAGKKTFFLVRIACSDILNCAFIQGLISTNTTPFTSIADGIYFSKASASTVINVTSVVGSVATTTTIPTAALTLANNTYFDLGFYVNQQGVINFYANNNSVGYTPQSGTGTTNNNRGPVAVLQPAALTTALLNPTGALQSGTATIKTMNYDYLLAARER